MGIIANDIEGIADSQLYELLLDQFGSGIQGRRSTICLFCAFFLIW